MSRLSFILSICFALTAGAPAAEEVFQQGQAAYDRGDYVEAVARYEQLLEHGMENKEVRYNLANALFKQGDLTHAVAHYRAAWYQAPRDPDINANLRFALNAAGAVPPAPSLIERMFCSLSRSEWIWTGIGAYLALATLLLLAIMLKKGRSALLKLALIPVSLLLLATGGWGQWNRLKTHPEAVVAPSGATALFAPLEGSTAHIKVPPAALVRQLSRDPKGWIEIEYDGMTGWVKKEQLVRVSP